jgi:hypothetical protein
MFTKSKISQSMIDAVNRVLEHNQPAPEPVAKTPAEGGRVPWVPNTTTLTEASLKVPTATGTKVYGSSYGNSAKAVKDQTRSAVDDIKEPKKSDIEKEKDAHLYKKTPSVSKNYLKPKTQAYFSKTGEPVKEELKGDQDKIDANHNDKIDAQDFKILKGKKKVKEDMTFANKLLETVRKSDVPAYLRKAKGDTPLTVADAKGPKKDTISAPENLAKARNEEVELHEDNLSDIAKKHGMELKKTTYGAGMKHPTKGEVSVNRYGEWNHYPAGSKSSKAHGDSTDKFSSLDKHLSTLKEASYEPSDAPITTDTLVGRVAGGKSNSFKSFKTRVKPLAKETGEAETPDVKEPASTTARKSIKAEEVEQVEEGKFKQMDIDRQDREAALEKDGWKKTPANVTDKSGAKHTPMSRARDLARAAFKKIKDEN